MKTTDQVLEQAAELIPDGSFSERTLFRYVGAGLVPAPEVHTGRGNQNRYDDATAAECAAAFSLFNIDVRKIRDLALQIDARAIQILTEAMTAGEKTLDALARRGGDWRDFVFADPEIQKLSVGNGIAFSLALAWLRLRQEAIENLYGETLYLAGTRQLLIDRMNAAAAEQKEEEYRNLDLELGRLEARFQWLAILGR